MFAKKYQVECPPAMVDYLIRTHYDGGSRPLRRCQARDLLEQIMYHCNYNELPLEITEHTWTRRSATISPRSKATERRAGQIPAHADVITWLQRGSPIVDGTIR